MDGERSATPSETVSTKPVTDGPEPAPGTVMGALADSQCRALLSALADEPQTATQLSDRCEIPPSTCYRKLNTLIKGQLVDGRPVIETGGRHATRYRAAIDDVSIRIGEEGIDVDCSKIERN